MIKQINDKTFEKKVLEEYVRPVCVLFFHNYGHYHALREDLEHLADLFDGRADFYALSSRENPSLAREKRVRKSPTVLLYQDGKAIARYNGCPRQELTKKILDALQNNNA